MFCHHHQRSRLSIANRLNVWTENFSTLASKKFVKKKKVFFLEQTLPVPLGGVWTPPLGVV